MTPNLDALLDLDYWCSLNPELTISESPKFTATLDFPQSQLDRISERIHHDGYIHEGPILAPNEYQTIRDGIKKLVEQGWPVAFIYIYDEVWDLFHKLDPFLKHFLGDHYGLLPHFWAWHVTTDDQGDTSGWPAHVDYPGECAFFDDFLVSLSLWIPLTDATPENGCMNIVPLSRHKTYDPPIKEPTDILLQDVRCLPAQAGSLLGWRQDLWHWSGRSSKYAKEPRISLSLEFQNTAFDPLCPPLFQLDCPPSPNERIQLICGQFAKYDHMESVNKDLEARAKEISPQPS